MKAKIFVPDFGGQLVILFMGRPMLSNFLFQGGGLVYDITAKPPATVGWE